jgi:4-amino-4-deoxy-L-arabinose transferase-like glycosyltransferase
MNFIARKIWMDNLLAGTTSLALCLAWLGGRTERWRLLLLGAGVMAALACSLKVTAAAVLPFVGWLAIPADRRRQVASLLFVLLPGALVLAIWFSYFRAHTGVWFPYWTRRQAFLTQVRSSPLLLSRYPILAQGVRCMPFLVVFLLSVRFAALLPFQLERASSLLMLSLLGPSCLHPPIRRKRDIWRLLLGGLLAPCQIRRRDTELAEGTTGFS